MAATFVSLDLGGVSVTSKVSEGMGRVVNLTSFSAAVTSSNGQCQYTHAATVPFSY